MERTQLTVYQDATSLVPPALSEAPGLDRVHPDSGATPTRDELRRKALSGVVLVALRDAAVRGAGLVGNIALARLLVPSEFGVVALGLTVLMFAQLFSDGGLGASLIRGESPPMRDDLRAVLGFQMVAAVILATAVAGAAVVAGRTGAVTAIMMAALPLIAVRTPSLIVLERDLNFAPLVKVEVAEQLAYYGWAITTVVLGAGVWGLATASIAKALFGTAILLRVSPISRLTPLFSMRRLRPMLSFGVRFQAVTLATALGSQLLNVGIAAVAGLAMLGLWTVANRLLQVPVLVFGAIWRVSYPAAARLLAIGESPRDMVERGAAVAAVGTGMVLVPVTAALPTFVPSVFGPRWAAVATILAPIFFALQASGPVSVSTAGYLYAVGETGTMLRSALIVAVSWLLVTLALLSSLGPIAIGLGGLTAALCELTVLIRAAKRRSGASFRYPILVPWLVATSAAGLGWILTEELDRGLLGATTGATFALTIYLGILAATRREMMQTFLRLVRAALSRPQRGTDSPTAARLG